MSRPTYTTPCVSNTVFNLHPEITTMNVSQGYSDTGQVCVGYTLPAQPCYSDDGSACVGDGAGYTCHPGTPPVYGCLIGTTSSTYNATAALSRVPGDDAVGDYNFSLVGTQSCCKSGCSETVWSLIFGAGETVTINYSNFTPSGPTLPCTASNVTGSTTGTDTNDTNIFYYTRNDPTTGNCEFQWGVTWGDGTTTYTAWDSDFDHVLDGFSLSRGPYPVPATGPVVEFETGTVTVSFS